MNTNFDTIFAVATGSGRGAVAIIRISGPNSGTLLSTLVGGSLPTPRRASLRSLTAPDGLPLDRALILWLPGPSSYTGQDSAELHVHAGLAVLDGVATALVTLGARPAEPGEFTRRAFCNGRMTLTEAEAVIDLAAAETEAQRCQALRQLDGELGRLFENWSTRVRRLLAEQEAMIDFPEEASDADPNDAPIAALIAELEVQLTDEQRGERLRDGVQIAICGPPNVGKSSLANALSGRQSAIVAPTAGTTRDVLEIHLVFGGAPVVLLDLAGLRDSEDPVETEGIRRARSRIASADLVLDINDTESGPLSPPKYLKPFISIATKIDIQPPPSDRLGVSVVTGEGLAALRDRLDIEVRRLTQASGPPPLTRVRHRAATLAAVAHLGAAIAAPGAEFRAEELRLALHCLGRVTGAVGSEDILDTIFAQFCIGK